MTVSKLTLAALVLGASLTPALADSGAPDDRLATFLAAQNQPKATQSMVEGRQAAPIATSGNAVDTFLEQRNANGSQSN